MSLDRAYIDRNPILSPPTSITSAMGVPGLWDVRSFGTPYFPFVLTIL